MTKGTTSFGKKNYKSHAICKRCGKRSFHIQKRRCASCGYPSSKMRKYRWSRAALGRRTTGAGRRRYLKEALRRERNGHMSGTCPPKSHKETTGNQ